MLEPICPQPRVWHQVHRHLCRLAAIRGLPTTPPTPLLVAGWAYSVEGPYGGVIGPAGGPMYESWRSEPAPLPDPDRVRGALEQLKEVWTEIPPAEVTAASDPLRFTGKKRRRLLVLIKDPGYQPPWGTWTSRGSGPERHTFTLLRAAVNEVIHPHEVDHVDFVEDAGDD